MQNSEEYKEEDILIRTKYLQHLDKALIEFPINQATERSKQIIEGLILRHCDIYFTTLNNSGSGTMLRSIGEIEIVIVDEACQCTELSSLMPFIFNPKQIILVGDPNQLPATTFGDYKELEKGYNRPMFERFQEKGIKYYMLNEQFRMSEMLCQGPSVEFYGGILKRSIKQPYQMPNWIPMRKDLCLFFAIGSFRVKIGRSIGN